MNKTYRYDKNKTYSYDKFMQLVTTQEADRNDASIGKCYLCGTLVEQNGNSTSVLKEELKKGDRLTDSIKHRVCKKKLTNKRTLKVK